MVDLREEICNALEGKEKCVVCGTRENVTKHHPSFLVMNINLCPYCHRLPINDFKKIMKERGRLK